MARVPTFALMTVRLDGLYQSVIWHGAATAARLLGVRLVALVGSSLEDPDQAGGPSEIYRIAKRSEFEGYLPLVGSLGNTTGPAKVRTLLGLFPPRPTVCIGVSLPGFASVTPDGSGMEAVVQHLVETHGLTEIAFLGGPSQNPDAIRRKDDFLRALGRYGLVPDPSWIQSTDFMIPEGRRAMRRILESARIPQAVVCANDATAIGANQELSSRGIRIPDDILLTGFDDIEEARTLVPPLTTVGSSTYQIAFRSVELLHEMLQGAPPRSEQISTEIVVRRSCGCRIGASSVGLPRLLREASGAPNPDRLREILSRPASADAFLRKLESAFDQAENAEIDHWEEVLHSASHQIADREAFAALVQSQTIISHARHGLDLRRRQALQQSMREQFTAVQALVAEPPSDDFPDKILEALRPFAEKELRLLLFKEDLSPLAKPDFDTAPFELEIDVARNRVRHLAVQDLFPPRSEKPGNWAILPLSLGGEHFGVVQVLDWVSNELALESLRLSLAMVLSSARKAIREAEVREELARLARRDDLTGLLNRRGLLEQGEVLVQAARRVGSRIGVVLCDIDDLKGINDRWGHADGDLAIQCLARALEDGFRQSDVVARLGGDEFAVITQLGADGSLEGAMERVRGALQRRSRELGRAWRARTSAGWMSWDPADGEGLETALARADAMLYSDKRQRKSGVAPDSSFPA